MIATFNAFELKPWMYWLVPLAGLFLVLVYRSCKSAAKQHTLCDVGY